MTTRRGDRRAAAFTLIELLLVMVILLVLAGLVVPQFVKQGEDVRLKAARVDIESIGAALDAFAIQCKRYPTTEEGLGALIQRPSNVKESDWVGPYLKKGLPKDPWGNLYVYACPGQHNTDSYDLHSMGPDLSDGSEDDIDNWSEK